MRIKPLLITLLFISVSGFAQGPEVEWKMAYGGSENESGNAIDQTSDGGYIVVGSSSSIDGDVTINNGQSDLWVVKLNSTGVIQWEKSLGGSDYDGAWSVQQTNDLGYIVAGEVESYDGDVTNNHGDGDMWIVKLNQTGVIEWQRTLGGSDIDRNPDIQQTIEGGYIVSGSSGSIDGDATNNHGLYDFWVVKLTTTGAIEWQHSIGGSDYDEAGQIRQTIDEGFIVVGLTKSNDGDVTSSYGNGDGWVVKLSAVGAIEWQKSYGGSEFDLLGAIEQTTDGGYILTGLTESNDGDVTYNHGLSDGWVVKLSADGEIEWQNTYGGTEDDGFAAIEQTTQGGYIITGSTESNDGDVTNNQGGGDSWVVKLDSAGNLEWQKTLGGTDFDIFRSVQHTTEGDYILAGSTRSNDGDVIGNNGAIDFWVVKMGSDLGVDENELLNSIILSPNPNKGKFTLSFSEEISVISIKVINALGKTVYSESNIPSGTIEIDQNFTAGVYFVNVSTKDSEETLKMIVD